MTIKIKVNGADHEVDVDEDIPLLWVLRDVLGMTGTKFGCGMALCGACTVHMNGSPIRSCIFPVGSIGDAAITTIEAVGETPAGQKIQQAWLDLEVIQCGYCKSGQIMSASALLAGNPNPTDADIDAAMSGNICRCGTYVRIREASKQAAQESQPAVQLKVAAEKSGWGQALSPGSGRGCSVQNVFGSYMAQIAEVEVSKDGELKVKRITCAVDCGVRINPNTVQAQVQSAIVYGLTAALFGEITLKDGRVQQSNFHDYKALRINEMPVIDVHVVESIEAPGGMGEPGTSALPPAVTNAIFAATGVRLRKLPIDPAKLKT